MRDHVLGHAAGVKRHAALRTLRSVGGLMFFQGACPYLFIANRALRLTVFSGHLS